MSEQQGNTHESYIRDLERDSANRVTVFRKIRDYAHEARELGKSDDFIAGLEAAAEIVVARETM